MKKLILIFAIISISNKDIQKEWNVKEIKGGNIIFDNQKILKTNLFNIEVITLLESQNKFPFIVFRGVIKSCPYCHEYNLIYIQNLEKLSLDYKVTKGYGFPGKLLDFDGGNILEEIEVYFGYCYCDKASIIWKQKILNEEGQFEKEQYILIFENGKITNKRVDYNSKINIGDSCLRLKGIDRTSEP